MGATKICYHRSVRTQQERRENDGCEIEVRGKRRCLPTNWDDLNQSSQNDRSWKRKRKIRYKTKNL